MYNERKSTGMTLIKHLAIRVGKGRSKNPNGVIGITIGDAMAIIEQFNEMRDQRDEALRLLKLRQVPQTEPLYPKGKRR